jgi:cell division protein FtsQ
MIHSRYKRVRSILWGQLLRWGGISLFSIFIIWVFYGMIVGGDVFRVTQFKMSGNFHVRSQELKSIFVPVLQRNLLTLDLDPLMRRVLDHPWVQEASIRKVLPDTLWVHIQERTPAAVVEGRGQSHWVDETGAVLGPAMLKSGASKPLPHITGIILEGLLRRDPEQLGRLQTGLGLIALIQSPPDTGVSAMEVGVPLVLDMSRGQSDPRLHLEGYAVRFGEGAYEEKWKIFMAIQSDLRSRELAPEEIDLRFTDQVIVKTF